MHLTIVGMEELFSQYLKTEPHFRWRKYGFSINQYPALLGKTLTSYAKTRLPKDCDRCSMFFVFGICSAYFKCQERGLGPLVKGVSMTMLPKDPQPERNWMNRNTTVSTNWLSNFYSHLFSLVYRKGCTHRDKMRTWMHWISSWRSLRILLHMLRAELIELVLCRCNNCFGQLSQPSTPNTLSLESKIALFLFLISCKQIFMFVYPLV